MVYDGMRWYATNVYNGIQWYTELETIRDLTLAQKWCATKMQLIRTCRPSVFSANSILKSAPESYSLGGVNPPCDAFGLFFRCEIILWCEQILHHHRRYHRRWVVCCFEPIHQFIHWFRGVKKSIHLLHPFYQRFDTLLWHTIRPTSTPNFFRFYVF